MGIDAGGPIRRPRLLTVRRSMIAVAYFAGLFAAARPSIERGDPGVALEVAGMALLLSPWLLAGLIAAFDAPSPCKGWAVLCIAFLFYPDVALYVDASVLAAGTGVGAVPRAGSLAVFNALILGATALFYRRMAPATCPACSHRTLVPLTRIGGQSLRLTSTRYCAACGGLYWRDDRGEWRAERRATWLGECASPATVAPPEASGEWPATSPPDPNPEAVAVGLGTSDADRGW